MKEVEESLRCNGQERYADGGSGNSASKQPPDSPKVNVGPFTPGHQDGQWNHCEELWNRSQLRTYQREDRHRNHSVTDTDQALNRCRTRRDH